MRSSITTAIIAASFAFSVNAAMAAPTPENPIVTFAPTARTAKAAAVAHARFAPAPAYRAPVVAAPAYLPRNQIGLDIGQFIQGMLGGGPVPYANLIRDVRNAPASGGGSYDWSSSPSYDASSAVSSAASDEQALSDAENQAIQQMNDTNALTASMAAAEEENDEANAATLQTEINAGM